MHKKSGRIWYVYFVFDAFKRTISESSRTLMVQMYKQQKLRDH